MPVRISGQFCHLFRLACKILQSKRIASIEWDVESYVKNSSARATNDQINKFIPPATYPAQSPSDTSGKPGLSIQPMNTFKMANTADWIGIRSVHFHFLHLWHHSSFNSKVPYCILVKKNNNGMLFMYSLAHKSMGRVMTWSPRKRGKRCLNRLSRFSILSMRATCLSRTSYYCTLIFQWVLGVDCLTWAPHSCLRGRPCLRWRWSTIQGLTQEPAWLLTARQGTWIVHQQSWNLHEIQEDKALIVFLQFFWELERRG